MGYFAELSWVCWHQKKYSEAEHYAILARDQGEFWFGHEASAVGRSSLEELYKELGYVYQARGDDDLASEFFATACRCTEPTMAMSFLSTDWYYISHGLPQIRLLILLFVACMAAIMVPFKLLGRRKNKTDESRPPLFISEKAESDASDEGETIIDVSAIKTAAADSHKVDCTDSRSRDD